MSQRQRAEAFCRRFGLQRPILLAPMAGASAPIVSSVMGLFPPDYVKKLKGSGIAWFSVATTVAEALCAEAAGADVIVAQGMEAGGHRGAFDGQRAERDLVGLFSLLPAVA